jgi:hypothetical protein
VTELVMNSSKVTVKMLDRTEVFCQRDNCEKLAVYLFSAGTTTPFCAAHCSEHAAEFASRLRIKLPSSRNITRTQRRAESERIRPKLIAAGAALRCPGCLTIQLVFPRLEQRGHSRLRSNRCVRAVE